MFVRTRMVHYFYHLSVVSCYFIVICYYYYLYFSFWGPKPNVQLRPIQADPFLAQIAYQGRPSRSGPRPFKAGFPSCMKPITMRPFTCHLHIFNFPCSHPQQFAWPPSRSRGLHPRVHSIRASATSLFLPGPMACFPKQAQAGPSPQVACF